MAKNKKSKIRSEKIAGSGQAPEQPSLGRRQTSVDDVDASSKEKKEQTGANKAAREEDREVGTVRLHVWKTCAAAIAVSKKY